MPVVDYYRQRGKVAEVSQRFFCLLHPSSGACPTPSHLDAKKRFQD